MCCHLISRMIRRAITRLSEQVIKMGAPLCVCVRAWVCACVRVLAFMCVTAEKMFIEPLAVTLQPLFLSVVDMRSLSLERVTAHTCWIAGL